jgi:N utilization substance protein B
VLEGAEALATRVIEALPDLDRRIAGAAEHWRLERIGRLERLILRLGVAELLDPGIPARTAIDEALWLTHRFAGSSAVPFVNGILDRVGRDLGRL